MENKLASACPCSGESAIELRRHLEATIIKENGGAPMVGGDALRRTMGFPTMAAFRKADARGILHIPVFAIERRSGKFALATDLAGWMVALREQKGKPYAASATE